MGKKKSSSGDGLNDSRFSHIKSDPLYAGLKNTDKKVIIDKRFAAALTDERFASRAKVDMRGRKNKSKLGNDMLDLYELEEDDVAEVKTESLKKDKKTKTSKKAVDEDIDAFFDENDDDDVEEVDDEDEDEAGDEEEEESSGDDEEDEDDVVVRRLDLARGEGNVSSSDDDSSDEEGDDDQGLNTDANTFESMQVEEDLSKLDRDAQNVEWASRRLAVCNLEWDHVQCEDILMLVKSFTPEDGSVVSVGIYMSDFGKEQLELEEKNGPPIKLKKPLEEYEAGEMDNETKTAVRQYLLDRLKYFYAVIEFDSEKSACAVYEECDGNEFEETGLKMDMRFIPDEMEFEQDRVRDFINADDINTQRYKPKKKPKHSISSTSAKIKWDEDDPKRSRKLLDAFGGDEEACRDLIANSDDESDVEGAAVNRNALLSLLNDDQTRQGLDIEWSGDEDDKKPNKTKNGTSRPDVEVAGGDDSDDSDGEYVKIDDDDDEIGVTAGKKRKLEKEKESDEPEEKLTGYKAYIKKKKSKLAAKKLEKRGLSAAEKTSTIKTAEVVENVTKDERFTALFTDSAYAIEPSSKQYKGSSLATRQAEAKRRRLDDNESQTVVAKKTHEEMPTTSSRSSGEDLVSKLKKKSAAWKKN